MHNRLWTVGAALAVLGWSAPQPQGVEVRTARFYRGPGTTLVDGFCRVPFDLLEPIPGRSGAAAYRIDVTVKDSTGLVLTASGWSQGVRPELLRLAGGSAVEHFAFAAERGRYAVEVVVTDSATGRRSRVATEVEAFGLAPAASDVILTSGIRRTTPGDTVPRPGEIRKGTVFLTGATRPVLTPREARLYYYVELYPGRPTQADISARVKAPDGRQLLAADAQPSNVAGAGGIAASGLDLAGLPPGEYRLELNVRYQDTTVVREAEFAMAGFEAAAAAVGAGASGAADAFAYLTEAALDSLYLPLVHFMEASERGVYDGLSLEGKRNYLRQFWSRRDPSPGTAENETESQYYARIAVANRRFREGGGGDVPGWRTDRGRILIRYGEPDEVLQRPQTGPTPPYEVWKYTRVRPLKFAFLDETRLGHYALVYTNERREPSRPDWEAILGREAAQDVARF
ncbi:MAG: GWxTD domain-containing protein [Gemmatimonadetes bacterium]|nr:GWxTD domain-containing protein [Gemmatimonadota bacterium]